MKKKSRKAVPAAPVKVITAKSPKAPVKKTGKVKTVAKRPSVIKNGPVKPVKRVKKVPAGKKKGAPARVKPAVVKSRIKSKAAVAAVSVHGKKVKIKSSDGPKVKAPSLTVKIKPAPKKAGPNKKVKKNIIVKKIPAVPVKIAVIKKSVTSVSSPAPLKAGPPLRPEKIIKGKKVKKVGNTGNTGNTGKKAVPESAIKKEAAVRKKKTLSSPKKLKKTVIKSVEEPQPLASEPACPPVSDVSVPVEALLPEESREIYRTVKEIFRSEASEEKISLPAGYGDNKIVLLVRDPYCVFAYWEISPARIRELKNVYGDRVFEDSRLILRVRDLSGDGKGGYFDISIPPFTSRWYINIGNPGHSYMVEIGLRRGADFIVVAGSNTVEAPADRITESFDEEWYISKEEFIKILTLSGVLRYEATSPGERESIVREFMREYIYGMVPGEGSHSFLKEKK